MKLFPAMNLKTRAMLLTAGSLVFVLAVNLAFTYFAAINSHREALMARAFALTDSIRKDIATSLAAGLPLQELSGMGARLHKLVEEERDIAGVMLMDATGKVLFSGNRAQEGTAPGDAASRKALTVLAQEVHSYSDNNEGFERVVPFASHDGRKVGVLRIAIKESAINKEPRKLLARALLVNGLSLLVVILVVSYFTSQRFRPIDAMVKTTEKIAAGNLSTTIAVKGGTEIDQIGKAINTLSTNLRQMLHKMGSAGGHVDEAAQMVAGAARRMSGSARGQQEAAEKTAAVAKEMTASIRSVAENADQMSQAAANASSSTSEMAVSVEEVASSARTLAASVEETASSIAEMMASIKQVSENTDAVAASAEQTSSSITELSVSVKEVESRAVDAARLAERVSQDASVRGMAAAREAISGMQKIKETVEATAEAINRLGKRSQEIGRILKVIDEVTDQTELLALNAAILATQAGERGKGFAVVAEEIKDLAERTAASTQEIETLIGTVREETAESMNAMEKGLKAVDAGVSLVNITNDVLRQVAESSRQSADTARAIEKTTSEQAKGTAQIMETSMNIAAQIEQVAHALQEQRAGTERISQTAQRMREITRSVKSATQEQSAGSRQIAEAVESVTMQAAQVARAMSEQSEGVRQISASITEIQQITQETVDVSIELEMAVQTIKEKTMLLQAELGGFNV